MGSRLNSAFNRRPTPIPPPIVCFVGDKIIVIPWPRLLPGWIFSQIVFRPPSLILTGISLKLEPGPTTLPPVISIRGPFWPYGLQPAQPVDPDGEPLPYPLPPAAAEATLAADLTIDLVFATTTLKQVIPVTFFDGDTVIAYKYIDLNRIIPNGGFPSG